MTAITKFLAGGVAAAALMGAAPAAAQYYPGYGNPGYGGNPVGQVINQVLGGGYGYGRYGYSQALVNNCSAAVQARLSRDSYGYGGYGHGGRVLGVTRIEPRASGRGMRVWGTASTGGYGYGGAPEIVWSCRTDYRGYVVDVDLKRGYGYNGYNGYNGYTPYNNNNYDYSQYGYRRY
jgi:hypothetical protein